MKFIDVAMKRQLIPARSGYEASIERRARIRPATL